MSTSSVLYREFGNTQTLPGPLYKFVTAVEIFLRRVESCVSASFQVRVDHGLDLAFVESLSVEFSHKIKTPLGWRKVHQNGPIVLFLNEAFHATDLPLAKRPNILVAGFSSKRELLLSEKDRDGKTIYNRLLDLEKRKIIAKTVRGDLDKWQSWEE